MELIKSFVLQSFFILSLMTSCTNSEIKFDQEPEIVQNPNKSVPLTCFIDFETKTEIKKVDFYIDDQERSFQLQYDLNERMEEGYLIYMLRPEKENQISIEITDASGAKHRMKEVLSFTTPALPDEEMDFPHIEITTNNSVEGNDDFILFNPRRRLPLNAPNANHLNKTFGMLAVSNKKGDVLWYYRTDSRISDFDLLPNGNLSYMTQDSRIVEMDFAGNIINQWYASKRPEGKMENAIPVDALTFHHDASILPNGNRLVCSTEIREIENYFTSEIDEGAVRKKQKVMGDVILEFTPGGELVHRWSCFDHLPVYRIGYETFSGYWGRRGFPGVIDWSHANAVVPIQGEEAYLVNFRYQSAMIKVNKASGEVEWIFAEPSGWGKKLQDKILQIPKEGWNWHQHSPRYTSKGNLLFFNNNNYQARPFNKTTPVLQSPSYAVEYKINEENKTVERVWDSRNDSYDPVVSIAMGRVSELYESGNVLACFGALLSPDHMDEMTWWNRGTFPQWTMVREYTRNKPSEIVWEMRILPKTKNSKVGWTLFGAEQIDPANIIKQ